MKVLIEESTLTNIADAIRTKTETNDTMYPKEMAGKVLNISTGIDTSDATAEAGDILSGETAYVNGVKVTGTIPVKEAEEYTPSTEDQVINSGLYLNGNQTIKGDTNLLAENIKSGVTIFGVEGNMQEGIDTSDGTATADDIMLNKTAYVNDEKVTGNFTLDSELATQDELISQILIGLEGKTAGGGIDTSDADATESDLMLGKTAYVNNTKLTGTFTIDDELTEQSNVISEIKSELANVNVGTAQGHYIWKKRVATIEAIESTGTQYIDTGFKPNQNTKVVLDYYSAGAESEEVLFGARTAYKDTAYALWIQSAYYQTDWGNSAVRLTADTTGRVVITKDKNITSKDTGEYYVSDDTDFQCAYSMYLFTLNQAGTAHTSMAKIRLYSCKIYDNDVLVRDFVPDVDDNNVVCLYDKVTQTYFYNQGTGDFTLVTSDDVLYVTSSNENKYPDGGTLDGYYYERVYMEEMVELPDTITAGETIVDAKLFSEFVASETSKEVIATTIKKSGTYKFTICTEYGGYAGSIYIRKNGTNVGEFPKKGSYYEGWSSVELTCTKGDRISLFVVTDDLGGSSTYSVTIYTFIISIAMDFNEFTYPSLISLLNSSKVSATYSNNKIKASGIYVDIPEDGTYSVSYSATRSDGTNSSFKSQIYKNGTALDNTGVTWGTTISDRNDGSYSGNITCAKGDKLEVYGYAPYNSEDSSYITIGTLRAEYVLN